MDDLIKDFIAETREMLEALSGEIVAWEAAPQDRARLDAIFRFVHTVKGNSGFFDLPRIGLLSHAAEDALSQVRSGSRSADPALVSAVLAIIDRLGELVEALDSGAEAAGGDDSGLIAALSASAEPAKGRLKAAPAVAPAKAARTIRLPVELLDRMMSGVSDLVLARNELARRLREAPAGSGVEEALDRVSTTLANLRDSVARTRMQRIEALFAPLPRMVRDLCAQTGKQVELETDGGDVEIDREMIEMIRDPLTHIVRNAIDHGIEAPADRSSVGKPGTGKLRVRARQSGNQILLEIEDDGRGIDSERLVLRALSAGLLTSDQAERLGAAQKAALIFEPGLSTAEAVTDISGRGVGMDVVRSNIERIGGLIELESRPGEGVRIALKVPLTLTIIPAFTVAADGRTYAIPRASTDEIVRARGAQVRVEAVGGGFVATIRGARVPLVSLRLLLGLGEAPDPASQTLVLLTPPGGTAYALAVDAIVDHEELVVKPAAPAVMATGLYAGTTIADDGKPVLLLDVGGLAARAGLTLQRGFSERLAEAEPAPEEALGPPVLVFRDLERRLRLAPVAALHRIDEVRAEAATLSAGRLFATVGGKILPLEGCEQVPRDGAFKLLRLRDGRSEIAYALGEVVEIAPLPSGLTAAAEPGPVAGIVLVGGEPAELLDLHWLFARHCRAAAVPAERPVCVLAGGDAYTEAILRPLVESAGYRVAAPGEPGSETPAVMIVSEDADAPVGTSGGRLVRLRSDPQPLGPGDESIHRYDREGLLVALSQARAGKGGRRG